MSSELERILREGRQALGDPESEATERARAAALVASSRHRRFRWRSSLVLAAALAAAVALGIGLGAYVAPSGSAAQEPVGVGFLPADGWNVTQSATQATNERPAHAIAANVPLQPGDGGTTVPYSTLLGLEPDGIVVVASFVRIMPHSFLSYIAPHFPLRKLPLRIDDAVASGEFGSLIRPEEPLGQYRLEAEIEGYSIDVDVYFGTTKPSRALLDGAQRQLERLIVAPKPPKP